MPAPPHRSAATDSPAPLNSLVMLWGLFPAIAIGLCLGLGLALGIVLSGRQTTPLFGAQPDAAPAPSSEDEEFMTYLDQSLETIERQTPSDAEDGKLPVPGSSSILSVNPFERASSSGLLPLPSVPIAAAPPRPLSPAPVQTAPIRLAPQPTAPAPVVVAPPVPVAPAPAAPAAPAPVAPAPQTQPAPAPTAAAPEETVIPNILPSPHVLVGLLQLGDRSAAIFEFDDGARRVRTGEAIGSSGWSLVSVSQDEAIIRRNGEVRSIYIGQRI